MLKDIYTKQEIWEIKNIVRNHFRIYLGKDIAQFYIKSDERSKDQEKADDGFVITISSQTKKTSLPRYETILRECVEDYRMREEYYLHEAKLTLEQMLKYCIITNDIKIAGFVRLYNCREIRPAKLIVFGAPGSGKGFNAILPQSSIE